MAARPSGDFEAQVRNLEIESTRLRNLVADLSIEAALLRGGEGTKLTLEHRHLSRMAGLSVQTMKGLDFWTSIRRATGNQHDHLTASDKELLTWLRGRALNSAGLLPD